MADLIFPGENSTGTLGLSRLPVNKNLVLWQGDAQSYVLTFTDSAGDPVDLTGCTPEAVIRLGFNDPEIISFTCTVQNVNEVKLFMSSAVSKDIEPGDYVWNFQITDADDEVRTYLAGDVTVYPEVDGA